MSSNPGSSAAWRVRLSRLLFRWAKRLDPAWYYRGIQTTRDLTDPALWDEVNQ